ncbi:tetratricopeptide repeat protein [Patescibacteria group bacterium]
MNEKLILQTRKLSLTLLFTTFILTPIFFLPFTTDFFGFNKQVLLALLTSLSLLSWLIYNLVTKTVRLTLSPLLLPFFLFTAAVTTSTIVNPSTPDTWMSRPLLYISLFIYFLLTTTLIQESKQIKKVLNLFLATAGLVSIWGILSVLGVFETTSLTPFLTLRTFSPTGSLLNLTTFLIATLPLSLTLAFKTRTGPKKLQYFLTSGLITSAIILVGYQLLPNQNFTPTLLPKLAGWSIAIDTFKSKVLLGAGPSNFVSQFTQFKPLSINQKPYWNILFTSSSNEYLHLMTTLGIAGITTFGLMIVSWLKLVKRDSGTRITTTQQALKTSIFTILALGLVFPFSTTLWVTFITLLAFTVGTDKSKNLTKVKDVILTLSAIHIVNPQDTYQETRTKQLSGILPWILAVPLFLGLVLTNFQVVKTYAAEYHFRKSLEAISNNQGGQVYDLQIKAINQRPQTDRYHVAYSNTNLALANSIASKGDLTDQDQQTVAQLIQQSIREAQAATQVNPNKSTNWSNLASIYRQLVNFADGADEFAIASYTRAVQLDPANPQLRLEFGGLLYALEDYQTATARFQEAIQLKPDYANAYYNLSNAYQQLQQYLPAYQALQQAIALIPSDSPDFDKAQAELTALEAKLPKQPTQPDENQPPAQLTEPSPLPEAPADFEPIPLESPEPSPTPEPEI